MDAGHGQGSDDHRDAPQKEDSARQGEKSPQQYKTMFVEDQYCKPHETQHCASQFAHVKRPRDVRHIV